eukprot:TRINITY_DN27468_c0_g2_i1.p1 TRINITY_DN27468_c0_g2~~TRINITY_DN27468_c0_g2_i1.p1  ORF type:complete len:227 (+),score=58.42 TRINITY_DN27468_c0_g2_i1:61-681(+)
MAFRSAARGRQLVAGMSRSAALSRTLVSAANPRRRMFAAAAGGASGSDDVGAAHMVDVSAKALTQRTARAACTVLVGEEVARRLAEKSVDKGDVFAVSEIAGIMAAKRTPDLLPLCHPGLQLSRAVVRCQLDPKRPESAVQVVAEVSCIGPTGVEMESLHAASTAALCIYDMCKPITKGIVITDLRLLSKSGGKSGDYVAPGGADP